MQGVRNINSHYWEPCNFTKSCAYASGFTILTDGVGVVTLWPSTTHSNMSVGKETFVWITYGV